MVGFASGEFQPLPISVFPAAEAEDAFRMMSQARHIGKVVLSYASDSVPARRPASEGFLAHADETFLVTGGSSGFGAAVASWLLSRGAGKILLASRSGRLPPELAGLAADGVDLVPIMLDVSDEEAVDALFARMRADGTRLSGVFHAAAVFRDGMLEQLSDPEIDAVLVAKAIGAWNLHWSSVNHGFDLRVFCTFSSVAETVGSIGQANYVAANSFLEGLTRYRRGLGLTAQTMAWSPLADAGVVARNDALRSYLVSVGLQPIRNADAFAALDILLSHDVPALLFAEANWSRLGRRADGTHLARFGPLHGAAEGDEHLWAELAAAPAEQWLSIIERALKDEIGRVLKIEPGQIAAERSLMELGFDSLSSIELKNRIEDQIGQVIPVSVFVGAPTLSRLVTLIVAILQDRKQRQQDGGTEPAETSTDTHLELGTRQARAYWAARFGTWPAALDFAGRHNPLLPGRGPLRQGRLCQLHVSTTTEATEAEWLLAFGQALSTATGRDELVIARHISGRLMPVRLSAGLAEASISRLLEQGKRHLSLDLSDLEALLADKMAAANAWPRQIGFSHEQPTSTTRHDILLEVASGSTILWFDSDAASGAFTRRLLSEVAQQLPGQLELGSVRLLTVEEPVESLGAPQTSIALPQQPTSLLKRIESNEATDAFRRAWTLSQAMRIAPGVGIDRLRQAVKTIEARHESLRGYFEGPCERRRFCIRPDAEGRVIVHDRNTINEHSMLSVVTELARVPIVPSSKHLFELHLVHFDSFDVVLIKMFEIVGDGWALAVVCDELIRAYLGLDLGPQPIALEQAMLLGGEEAGAELGGSMPVGPGDPVAPLGRMAKGLPYGRPELLAAPDEIVVTIDAGPRRNLQRTARALGGSENALIAAAYVMVLAGASGVDEIALSVTSRAETHRN